MDFGVIFANVGPFMTAKGAKAMGQGAEAAGFDSVWTVEHVLVPEGYESDYPYDDSGKMPGPEESPIPDPLIWLTYVGACTNELKLATGVLILPQRNPGVLAKQCATIDMMTGGRMILGIGVGWLEEEFNALGIPFERRGKRTDEYVAALRALWSQSLATHTGEFTNLEKVYSQPQPVNGSIPIVVGGHTDIAARRAGRLGDGFFPGKGSDDELRHLIGVMRETAEKHDRDPDAIEITASGAAMFGDDALDKAATLADMGITRLMIPPLSFDPAAIGDAFAQFGEKVIAPLNG